MRERISERTVSFCIVLLALILCLWDALPRAVSLCPPSPQPFESSQSHLHSISDLATEMNTSTEVEFLPSSHTLTTPVLKISQFSLYIRNLRFRTKFVVVRIIGCYIFCYCFLQRNGEGSA